MKNLVTFLLSNGPTENEICTEIIYLKRALHQCHLLKKIPTVQSRMMAYFKKEKIFKNFIFSF